MIRWLSGILLLLVLTVAPRAGTLIVSNYPEEIYEPGVLVSTELQPSRTRLMYYHISRAKKNYLIQTVLQNLTDDTVSLQYIRSDGGPSPDEIHSGHRSALGYWRAIIGAKWTPLVIGPRQRIVLSEQPFRMQNVSTSLIEIDSPSSAKIQLTTAVVDPDFPALSALNKPANHYRFGTFDTLSKQIFVDYSFSPLIREIPIGDNNYPFDAKSGITLRGNYGLIYDITIHAKNNSPFPRELQLLFAPAGGIARGTFLINQKIVETGFINHSTNLAPEKLYSTVLAPHSESQLLVQTLPQGGCFYPVNLVIASPIPANYKENK